MRDVTAEIQDLFDRYLSAWNARDFHAVADCYAEPSLFILPHATVPIADKDALVALLGTIFDGLDAEGFSHTEIGALTARACGENLAVVDATDVRRLRKDGSVLEIIDGHYIARQVDGIWCFTVATACAPGWKGPRDEQV
ncbi:DUF4440 domain-containing protein [Roseobacter litoralis]|uniref:DUF6841 family protein n=1 Tax=Roseobacter litoralis TaxID=42443 RepID=UPI002492FC2E|nr:hypothetical protein [Roseobacter litoralis]